MAPVNRLCAQLRAEGRRVTPQRRAIIEVLQENNSHPSAEQVFARVRSIMPDLSPATVYNTLHELVEIGTLRELDLGRGERRYDVNIESHDHLICLGCGRVEDVPHNRETPGLPPEHAHGFQVVDCSVVFRGYCPACAARDGQARPLGLAPDRAL